MNDIDFEEQVAVMLRERAKDIGDHPAPGIDGREAVELDASSRERSRAWLVAAVVAVLACVGGVALLLQDDDQRVETGPVGGPSTAATTPAPLGPTVQLEVSVRQRQSASYDHGSVAVMEVLDDDGARIGDLHMAPPFWLYDPDAEPGSVGSDMVTAFLDVKAAPGGYTISVWQYPCAVEGCPESLPADALDADRFDECTGEVTASEDEGASLTVVFTPGAGCDYVGPLREEDRQAADDLLQRQIANGWVPYGGRPAMPDFVVPPPTGAWIPAGFDGDPGCERPPEIPDPVDVQCIYDAPAGDLIGYHISNIGFVPLDRIDDFDVNEAYVEEWGCSPILDDTCRARHDLEGIRRILAGEDLPPEQRAMFEQQVADLEAQIAGLEAND